MLCCKFEHTRAQAQSQAQSQVLLQAITLLLLLLLFKYPLTRTSTRTNTGTSSSYGGYLTDTTNSYTCRDQPTFNKQAPPKVAIKLLLRWLSERYYKQAHILVRTIQIQVGTIAYCTYVTGLTYHRPFLTLLYGTLRSYVFLRPYIDASMHQCIHPSIHSLIHPS